MFIKNLFISRLISTFPCKLRQCRKLSIIAKSSNNQCSYNNLLHIIIPKQKISHITSVGKSVRSLSVTNKTNILSKAMSGEGDQNLIVNYDDILKAQQDEKVVIIDVREDSEVQETGKLPGSIHIPMGQVSNALTNLSNEEFEQKFHQKKPSQDTKIILSCRSGRRSASVQSDLQKLGYKNAYNYAGGWLDWESKHKV